MIAKITRAYVRRYSDSEQITAYIEWQNSRKQSGRTEGPARRTGTPCCTCGRQLEPDIRIGRRQFHVGSHIAALLRRAEREGIPVEYETW